MFRCLLASRFSSTTVGILTATSATADVGPDVDQTDSTTLHSIIFPSISPFHYFISTFIPSCILPRIFTQQARVFSTIRHSSSRTPKRHTAMIFVRIALLIALLIGFCQAGTRRGDGTAYSGTNQVRR